MKIFILKKVYLKLKIKIAKINYHQPLSTNKKWTSNSKNMNPNKLFKLVSENLFLINYGKILLIIGKNYPNTCPTKYLQCEKSILLPNSLSIKIY
jgi:hypothetical protein